MVTKLKKIPVNQKCFYCMAGCCQDVVMEIDEPEDFEDFDNIRWYLYHKDVFVYIDEEDWHVGFRTRCDALNADNSCGVYLKRPEICRDHSPKDCSEYTGPGAEDDDRSVHYDHYFNTADDLDAWLIEEDEDEMIRKEDKKLAPRFIAKAPTKKLKGRAKR